MSSTSAKCHFSKLLLNFFCYVLTFRCIWTYGEMPRILQVKAANCSNESPPCSSLAPKIQISCPVSPNMIPYLLEYSARPSISELNWSWPFCFVEQSIINIEYTCFIGRGYTRSEWKKYFTSLSILPFKLLGFSGIHIIMLVEYANFLMNQYYQLWLMEKIWSTPAKEKYTYIYLEISSFR